MNVLEDKLRTALRETGEEIVPHSVPPLRLRGGERRLRLPRLAARGRWSAWLTPLAAAASVAAVVAASLAISATFHGHSHGPGPAAAARSHGAPAGGQAALRDVPRYFVSLSPMWTARSAEVRSTVTGRTLATITPPRPYRIFTWVSAAADDHTFVLAAQRYWHIGHGQAGMPAQNRDNATPTVFFKLTFDPATHTAALTPLAIPETIPSSSLAGVGLSPDGSRLALDIRQPVQAGPASRSRLSRWPPGRSGPGPGTVAAGSVTGSLTARSSPGRQTGRRWNSSSGAGSSTRPRTSGCSTPVPPAAARTPPGAS